MRLLLSTFVFAVLFAFVFEQVSEYNYVFSRTRSIAGASRNADRAINPIIRNVKEKSRECEQKGPAKRKRNYQRSQSRKIGATKEKR